jgi:non-heme chloroperoxidase
MQFALRGPTERMGTMATITTKDGTTIFYKDWGKGAPIVFSHGWPLSSDAWNAQLLYFASQGYRVIAHDRRGHGRSSQPWEGHDMDTYADDLSALMDKLDLKAVTIVGHSTGGGEITRYMGRHGTKRIAKAVLVGAVPPSMLQTNANPQGTPLSVFDGLRTSLEADRSQFYEDFSGPFYGANRAGSKVSQGLRDEFWLISMQAGLKAVYDCVKAFSETDFTEDLKRITVPTLIIHGEDDQVVPIAASARRSVELIKTATLKIYPEAPHGLTATHRDQFNRDLLEFIRR